MASNVTGLLKGRWVIWGLSLFFSVLAGLGVLMIVGKAADRVPYYVLNVDAPARTQVSAEIVTQVDVNADALPPTALAYEQVVSGEMFTTVPLTSGDILTTAVTGTLTPINYKLPAGYVTTSLEVEPQRAVGGKIRAGNYIDIAAVEDGENGPEAKVVLQHILVLDVTVDPSSISDAAVETEDPAAAPGPESMQVRGGIPQIYTLAVSPKNFVRVALIADGKAFLALSANPTVSEFDASANLKDMFKEGPVKNGGVGTGSVFGPGDLPAVAPSAEPSVAPPTEPSNPQPSENVPPPPTEGDQSVDVPPTVSEGAEPPVVP